MQKIINIILKLVLSLIMIMPILGTFGLFPAPTADMYNNPLAFEFIQILMTTKYINIIMAVVFTFALVLLWAGRVTLAALLILPITVNIVAFHLVLDGGLLTGGAVMGNILMILNLTLLWQQRAEIIPLTKRSHN